ncbi:MAG: hypothetical protein Q9225_000804 [Loekoesia sp. 1 TL-2023]
MSDKDSFYRHVLQRASELRAQFNGLKGTGLDATARNTTTTQCLGEINNLKNEIRAQAHETAPHDQRTFNEVLKGLNEQLQQVRSEAAPKRKFAFKPKASAASISPSPDIPEVPSAISNSAQPVEEFSEHVSLEPIASVSGLGGLQAQSILNDIHHALRTESSLEHVERGIMVANSSDCIFRCPIPSPKLTVNNLQSSVLMSGPINGAALVMEMNASEMTSLEGATSDQWDQVSDFNWLKAGHSPNWSILEPENQKGPDQWTRLQTVTDDEVGVVLRDFGVTGFDDQYADSTQ